MIFKTLLNHPKVNLGSKNDSFVGITKGFFEEHSGSDLEKYKSHIDYFMDMLIDQSFDNYSDIKYLHFRELDKLGNPYCPEWHSDLKKMLKFCIMDILETSK